MPIVGLGQALISYLPRLGDEEPSEPASQEAEGPVAPRPAYGYSKDGRNELKQVLLSLGVSGDGGLPLRLDVHFISSLPVAQRTVCKAWAHTRHVQIVWAVG